MDGHDNDAERTNDGAAAAPQGGIFSSPDLTIESDNIPANVGGAPTTESTNNSARIAAAFARTNASQQRQLTTVAAQNSIASTATGDIQLPKERRKSKLPIVIIVVALLVVGGVATLLALRGVIFGGAGSANVEHTALNEAKKKYDQFATYVLFGESKDVLEGEYEADREYTVEQKFYSETYDTEFWGKVILLAGEALTEYQNDPNYSWGTESQLEALADMVQFLSVDNVFIRESGSKIMSALEKGEIGQAQAIVDTAYSGITPTLSQISDYIGMRKKQLSDLVGAYSGYASAGCFTDGSLDDVCISDIPADDSDMIDDLLLSSDTMGHEADVAQNKLIAELTRRCYAVHNMIQSEMEALNEEVSDEENAE